MKDKGGEEEGFDEFDEGVAFVGSGWWEGVGWVICGKECGKGRGFFTLDGSLCCRGMSFRREPSCVRLGIGGTVRKYQYPG